MSTETCDFTSILEEGGPVVFCVAPPVIDVRWRWTDDSESPPRGSMCESHWIIACEQLAADPGVEYASIQVMRREHRDE